MDNEELLDLDALVEVVQTYKCKFCVFASNNPHEVKNHLTTIHLSKPAAKNEHPIDNALIHVDLSAADIPIPGEQVSHLTIPGDQVSHLPIPGDQVSHLPASEDQVSHLPIPGDQVSHLPVSTEQVSHLLIPGDQGSHLPVSGDQVSHEPVSDEQSSHIPVPEEQLFDTKATPITQDPLTELPITDDVTKDRMGAVGDETVVATRELFLCGQCHSGFHTMDACKTHIEKDHLMFLSGQGHDSQPTEVQQLPASKSSLTGESLSQTQNKTPPRKCGRKRGKSKPFDETEGFDEELAEELLDSDDYRVRLHGSRGAGKRRIKPPKTLMKTYFIGVKKDGVVGGSESTVEQSAQQEINHENRVENGQLSNTEERAPASHVGEAGSRDVMGDPHYDPSLDQSEPPVELRGHGVEEQEKKKRRKLDKDFETVKMKRKKCKYKCEVSFCRGKFSTKDAFETHEQYHGSEGVLVCQECGEKFSFWGQCALHLWRYHQVDMDLYRCDLCHFRTNMACKLGVHRAIHSELRPYTCKMCGKRFKQASQLISHELLHGAFDESEHANKTCSLCETVFETVPDLRQHLYKAHHCELKDTFQCPHCPRACSSKGALVIHVRTHTGQKPFFCDFCSFTCADHNTLRRHRMRHTGDKPYACEYCDYTCIQSISLKLHIKSKHGEGAGLYACKLCSFHTVSEKLYTTHILEHERNQNEVSHSNNNLKPKIVEIHTMDGNNMNNIIIVPNHSASPIAKNKDGGDAKLAREDTNIRLTCSQCNVLTVNMADMLEHFATPHHKRNKSEDSNGATNQFPVINIQTAFSSNGSGKTANLLNQEKTVSIKTIPGAEGEVDIESETESIYENDDKIQPSTEHILQVGNSNNQQFLLTSNSQIANSSHASTQDMYVELIKTENNGTISNLSSIAPMPLNFVASETEYSSLINNQCLNNTPGSDNNAGKENVMQILQLPNGENVVAVQSMEDDFLIDSSTGSSQIYEVANDSKEGILVTENGVSFQIVNLPGESSNEYPKIESNPSEVMTVKNEKIPKTDTEVSQLAVSEQNLVKNNETYVSEHSHENICENLHVEIEGVFDVKDKTSILQQPGDLPYTL